MVKVYGFLSEVKFISLIFENTSANLHYDGW